MNTITTHHQRSTTMSDNKPAMRQWRLAIDGNRDQYQRVDAAYYATDPKSGLVEFKDTQHRVVLAVPLSRVILIAGEDNHGTVVEVNLNPSADKETVAKAISETIRRQV